MGGKHCGETEKMLVTSIFSFSHNVLKAFFSRAIKSGHCVGMLESACLFFKMGAINREVYNLVINLRKNKYEEKKKQAVHYLKILFH